jgi:hypothetical protein
MIQKVNYQEWLKKRQFGLKIMQIAHLNSDCYDSVMTEKAKF